MRVALSLVGSWAASLTLGYLTFAFVCWDLNAGHWNGPSRMLCAVLSLVACVFSTGLVVSVAIAESEA